MSCSIAVFSQYVENQDAQSSMKKNAIGIGLNPIVAMMLGAGSEELHYGLQYRHALADHKRLRFGGYYQWNDQELNSTGPIGIDDSTLYKLSGNEGYDYFEFRAGMEWSDFTKSHDAIYGCDLIFGYDQSTFFETRDRVLIGPDATGSTIYGDLISKDTLKYYTDRSLLIGLSPTFGYRVNMGNRLELMAWMSTEFVHSSPLDTDNHGIPQYHRNNSYTSFRMRLLDLVLSYRF